MKSYRVGQKVRVVSGKYVGFVGAIVKIDSKGNCSLIKRRNGSEFRAVVSQDLIEQA